MLAEREACGAIHGGPLLTWLVRSADGAPVLWGQLLDDQGCPETTAECFVDSGDYWNAPGAVFTGEAFLLAIDSTVVRFSLDGGLSRTTPLAARAEFGRLAWTGTEAAIVYGAQPNDSGGMFIQRLDGLGAALGPPVRLANLEFRATPSVAVGQDVLTVLMGPDMTSVGKNLSVLRLARDGALVAGPFDVVRDYVSSPSIAATSAGFFLAWIGGPGEFPGHIGVARLEAPMP